jgi:hypothetical protein
LGGLAAQARGGGSSFEFWTACPTTVIPAFAGMTVKVSSALATLRCVEMERAVRSAA